MVCEGERERGTGLGGFVVGEGEGNRPGNYNSSTLILALYVGFCNDS